jgi:hypothetical protein
MPTDADPLTLFPDLHTGADIVDHASHLVSRHERILHARKEALLGDDIAVADSAGLNANPHLSGARLWNVALYDFEVRAWFWHLHCFHFSHSPFLFRKRRRA